VKLLNFNFKLLWSHEKSGAKHSLRFLLSTFSNNESDFPFDQVDKSFAPITTVHENGPSIYVHLAI